MQINILASWHALVKNKKKLKEKRNSTFSLKFKNFVRYIFSFYVTNKISKNKKRKMLKRRAEGKKKNLYTSKFAGKLYAPNNSFEKEKMQT